MKKLFACLLAGGMVVAGAGLAAAATVTGVKVLETGIFRYVAGPPTGTTPEGVSIIPNRGHRLIKSTGRVPAVMGTMFGFTFRLEGQPRGYLETFQVVVTCPGLHVPGRKGVVRRTVGNLRYRLGGNHIVSWVFTKPWELVPGKWTIQLVHQGKLLAQKSFVVYKP
jgi:hypothetical protein